MIQLKGDNMAFFDVDDTLIMWEYPAERESEAIEVCIEGTLFYGKGVPHKRHIEMIKRHKAWGNGVVVWSRSGSEWANAVVKALGLENHVDLVMSKPYYYYDDKPCCKILGEHRYQDDNKDL